MEGGGEGEALAVGFSPDGRMLALGGYGRLTHVWDVRTQRVVHALDTRGGEALEFSPDGRMLAVSGGAAGVSLWDVATGIQTVRSLTAGPMRMMDLSSDGRRLLMTADDGRVVWDVDPSRGRGAPASSRTGR